MLKKKSSGLSAPAPLSVDLDSEDIIDGMFTDLNPED